MSMESCVSGKHGWAASSSGPGSVVTIHVKGSNWGKGRPQDIQTLLVNVASHMARHLREDVSPVIEVRNRHPHGPMIVYRPPRQTVYWVMLRTTGTYWAQYSYQFAHEFCHLLSNYERLEGSANAWFHESICELASLFTLRSMAMTWTTDAPYPNWTDYANALWDYAEGRLSTVRDAIPGEAEGSLWLQSHEAEARIDPYIREGNLIIAARMLPILERHPEGWNAIRVLPVSNAPIDQYLALWKEKAHPCDRGFIDQIASALGMPIPERID